MSQKELHETAGSESSPRARWQLEDTISRHVISLGERVGQCAARPACCGLVWPLGAGAAWQSYTGPLPRYWLRSSLASLLCSIPQQWEPGEDRGPCSGPTVATLALFPGKCQQQLTTLWTDGQPCGVDSTQLEPCQGWGCTLAPGLRGASWEELQAGLCRVSGPGILGFKNEAVKLFPICRGILTP